MNIKIIFGGLTLAIVIFIYLRSSSGSDKEVLRYYWLLVAGVCAIVGLLLCLTRN